ncbi:DUF433 domain-containing protein [Runella sp.]|jgi:uncharacterized protein (DUF433 family)|uniref:DUF433 domain-containing protein n=1 Tax=Runella sp. TaxID=1960881 RepID=UPI002627FE5F|nr:DUF433 domain-containing protein [Runella sp.]
MKGIVSDPDILSGTPVFMGTRVPVKTLIDYLASGVNTLQDFLEDYPSVNPTDAKQVIGQLGQQLLHSELIAA